ncbi:helix-turn-helix domain-containing protein [Deinococcus sp. VB142]|uniref:Helix-turn-helix domain-containing protein n=1 Tax=Deinococcus sp. VB142 TaxID=3112952 RepID=A0AAU6Q420_9DEIO
MSNATLSPGKRLQELLESRGMKNVELASLLGRSSQYVTDIIKGKKDLDVELALQLEQVLGGEPSAQQWMTWVIEYRRHTPEISRMEVLSKPYAKELIKLKWINGKQSPAALAREIDAFWALKDIAVGAFRQTAGNKRLPDVDARAAWSIEVYRRACQQTDVADYDKSRLPELYGRLKGLMQSVEDVKEVKPLLASYGIRLVFLPNPPKCPVDGVGYVNEGKPYIGLSLRIARIDSFWFTLLHEMKHIEAEDKIQPADTIDRPVDSVIERRANAGARQLLFDDERYQNFVDRGVFTLPAVDAEVARTDGTNHAVHRAILLGRLKNDYYLDWSQFAREHTGVRDVLLTS